MRCCSAPSCVRCRCALTPHESAWLQHTLYSKAPDPLAHFNPACVVVCASCIVCSAARELSRVMARARALTPVFRVCRCSTNMPEEKIGQALEGAKAAGITNILALRGGGEPQTGPRAQVRARGTQRISLVVMRHPSAPVVCPCRVDRASLLHLNTSVGCALLGCVFRSALPRHQPLDWCC